MTLVTEAAKLAIGRATLPWLIAVSVVVLSITGGAGMYFGSLIERGRHAEEIAALKNEQIRALEFSTELYKQATLRGDEVSNRFEAALKSIRVENTTFVNEVRTETEKLVYTDCRLPDSGADLLRKQVDGGNLRLLGKGK